MSCSAGYVFEDFPGGERGARGAAADVEGFFVFGLEEDRVGGAFALYGDKSFWTTIGSAWQRDDGTVSINVNENVQLLVTKGLRIMLAPVTEK